MAKKNTTIGKPATTPAAAELRPEISPAAPAVTDPPAVDPVPAEATAPVPLEPAVETTTPPAPAEVAEPAPAVADAAQAPEQAAAEVQTSLTPADVAAEYFPPKGPAITSVLSRLHKRPVGDGYVKRDTECRLNPAQGELLKRLFAEINDQGGNL